MKKDTKRDKLFSQEVRLQTLESNLLLTNQGNPKDLFITIKQASLTLMVEPSVQCQPFKSLPVESKIMTYR